MSGVLGLVNSKGEGIDKKNFQKCLETLKHRGPDGERYYFSKNVALGWRRLAIVNINDDLHIVSNEDQTVRAVSDGIIYNFRILRTELMTRGHTFKTNSAVEVVVHAYEEYGEECFSKFNGIYALAILDEKKHKILLARDRIGVRPLYFSFVKDRLVFASEIKAIVKDEKIKAEPDYNGINDYLTFQYCLGSKTLFKNISRVLPGHYLSWNYMEDSSFKQVAYWDVEYHYDINHTEEYFIEKIRFILEDAVRLSLISDVPVGTHLSGGIDSSSVTCFASGLLSKNKLKLFTGYYEESKEYDETDYAKAVCDNINGEHHLISIRPEHFIENIAKVIYFMDEPQAGPGVFGQFMVGMETSKHVKVALSGEGGDELFLGYAKYLIAYLEECINGAIMETADKSKYAVTLESIIPNLPVLKTYKPLLQYFWSEGLFGSSDWRYFRLNNRLPQKQSLINTELFKNCSKPFEEFEELFNRKHLASYINKMAYYDLKASLPAVLQVDDRTSMAFSVENRPPLLDYRIVELIASIPPAIKYNGGQSKYLLRKAVQKVVPEKIWNRKDKMGFPLPLTEWSRGVLKNFFYELFSSKKFKNRGIFNQKQVDKLLKGEKKHGRQIWGMLCLELWFREYIDNASSK